MKLLFSTLLNITGSMDQDSFIKLIIKWNNSSKYKENIIPDLEWNGKHEFEVSTNNLWIKSVKYENIIAVRYQKKDGNGGIWNTDYIMNFDSMKMAIQLYRSYTLNIPDHIPEFSAPHFISLLAEGGYLQDDEGLPVSNEIIEITDENANLFADRVNETSSYRLPVVYVSRTYNNDVPVDVGLLGSKLKGVAHVLLLKDNLYNPFIRELCHGNNEYYGAIGIYYPGKSKENKRFIYRPNHPLFDMVLEEVAEYSNSQRIDKLFIWDEVINSLQEDTNKILRDERIKAEEALKEALEENQEFLNSLSQEQGEQFKSSQRETQDLIATTNEGREELIKENEELTRSINELEARNAVLKNKLEKSKYDKRKKALLFIENKADLNPGEIKDVILDILSDALKKSIKDKSRRADVLKDIINTNKS